MRRAYDQLSLERCCESAFFIASPRQVWVFRESACFPIDVGLPKRNICGPQTRMPPPPKYTGINPNTDGTAMGVAIRKTWFTTSRMLTTSPMRPSD